MPYSATAAILVPIAKSLPSDAMAVFVDTANEAEDEGYDHNGCMKAGWDAVREGWQKPGHGRVWVAKDDPGAGDVHVDAPMGGKGKAKLPKQTKADPVVMKDAAPRALRPHDDKTAKTPFPYDPNALANLREDQVPRFFGALTDPARLEDRIVPLSSLTAMQNRVDPEKVDAMRSGKVSDKPPVVVAMNGRNYIADGHHRATAAYLDGEDNIAVKFKDLDPESNALKMEFETEAAVAKVDDSLGLVFGFAIVCKIDGEPYFDTQGDHIPEDAMLKAASDFMVNSRVAKDMHDGGPIGPVVFAFPLTDDIAKAMGIESQKTGLMIAMKPPAPILAKYQSGEYTGFSIGGRRVVDEEVA